MSGFVGWYRRRPFVGGCLSILAGVEMFLSSQLDLGNMHIQVGIEGLQATILPILLVLLGLLSILMPAQRIFYGVLILVIAVYSLVGVNLGGFFIGMLLGMVGGVMVVSWMPRRGRGPRARHAGDAVAGAELAAGAELVGTELAGVARVDAELVGATTAGTETAAESAGAESAGAESAGAESAGAETAGVETAGAELVGVTTAGAESAVDAVHHESAGVGVAATV
ncbi:DUF6114 domain-containing protein [Subtercola endophyticus]|uniref:DUF6114 domain-containing protein n=1 Tax=Subtercola endophyticus TaxID=2895559 RepID=UPI001E540BEF|nr:DUF6114 domain-containing protein [Subtercola endophyticus]UFS59682.1 DUF6114 domain-containing protein [Subtercola endophyticus]